MDFRVLTYLARALGRSPFFADTRTVQAVDARHALYATFLPYAVYRRAVAALLSGDRANRLADREWDRLFDVLRSDEFAAVLDGGAYDIEAWFNGHVAGLRHLALSGTLPEWQAYREMLDGDAELPHAEAA